MKSNGDYPETVTEDTRIGVLEQPNSEVEADLAAVRDEVKGKTLLRVEGPPWATAFNLPGEDGATLSVDRQGTFVPNEDAQRLIETAAASGVTITEVSE